MPENERQQPGTLFPEREYVGQMCIQSLAPRAPFHHVSCSSCKVVTFVACIQSQSGFLWELGFKAFILTPHSACFSTTRLLCNSEDKLTDFHFSRVIPPSLAGVFALLSIHV